MTDTPTSVLSVYVHNSGRSQMAAGYLSYLADDRIKVRSAESRPADQINPTAVAGILKEGIDAVRPVRDDIRDRVEELVGSLNTPTTPQLDGLVL